MKIDTQMRDFAYRKVPDAALGYERIGFDCIWSFEAAHNPFMPLALAATATGSIHVGTNIAVAFARSPFAMAQAAWDLQKNSGGRFHLGVGTQVRAHVERRLSMPFDHPAARVADYIRCMRAIWDTFQNDTRPDYQGPFYRFQLINPFFNPGPIEHPRIPVYLAGVNRIMCRTAGEVADGFHVHPMHSVGYLRDVVRPAIDEGARTRGLTVDDLELYAPIFAVTGDTEAERSASEQEIRRQIAFYASTPNYRSLLEYHGLEEVGRRLSALMRQGDLDAMPALIPDAFLEEIAVVAPLPELGAALRRRCEGLLDRVSLYFPLPEDAPEEPWRAFVSAFREAA